MNFTFGSVLIFSVFLYAIAGSIRRTHHHQVPRAACRRRRAPNRAAVLIEAAGACRGRLGAWACVTIARFWHLSVRTFCAARYRGVPVERVIENVHFTAFAYQFGLFNDPF